MLVTVKINFMRFIKYIAEGLSYQLGSLLGFLGGFIMFLLGMDIAKVIRKLEEWSDK